MGDRTGPRTPKPAPPGGTPPPRQDLFMRVERVAELPRKRGPLVIETYSLDLLDGAQGDVSDRSPPPELQ